MTAKYTALRLALTCLTVIVTASFQLSPAQETAALQWIWFSENDPVKKAQTCYFRKHFEVTWPAEEATLDVASAGPFTVWLNGIQIGTGDDGGRAYAFDVKKQMLRGTNVIAVRASQGRDAGGLLVR